MQHLQYVYKTYKIKTVLNWYSAQVFPKIDTALHEKDNYMFR
jgi:hypothetical protein